MTDPDIDQKELLKKLRAKIVGDFKGKAIMVQGTTSHSGKSTMVVALCRIFSDMGFKVAPFKSQNMSLNSYVNSEGAEIARSQVVQAMAARVKPIAAHNPILLKPKGAQSSQIILMGKPFMDYSVENYYTECIPQLVDSLKDSLRTLLLENDIVVIEGAGSPAEINLVEREIANMFVAKMIDCPVILIADIDRGGVFASIYGTIKLLKQEEQDLMKLFVINKFRGNVDILMPGVDEIEGLVGKKCIGIIPYIPDLKIPAEDSLSLEETEHSGYINVNVIRLPRISNFTDFEPLAWEADINLRYVTKPSELDGSDLIIIPGTKNSVKDLQWLEETGISDKIKDLHNRNTLIIGICGGYQMLGEKLTDKGIEGDTYETYTGLGLLPINTHFDLYEKQTRQIKAKVINFPDLNGLTINGFEIHMGRIIPKDSALPLFKKIDQEDAQIIAELGTVNIEKNVMGTFLHGLWDNDKFRSGFVTLLRSQAMEKGDITLSLQTATKPSTDFAGIVEHNIQRIANVFKENLDFDEILTLLNLKDKVSTN